MLFDGIIMSEAFLACVELKTVELQTAEMLMGIKGSMHLYNKKTSRFNFSLVNRC